MSGVGKEPGMRCHDQLDSTEDGQIRVMNKRNPHSAPWRKLCFRSKYEIPRAPGWRGNHLLDFH
jgi:hypothetical protein